MRWVVLNAGGRHNVHVATKLLLTRWVSGGVARVEIESASSRPGRWRRLAGACGRRMLR